MGQTISITPEIWARVRHLAFDTQSTASKLTEMALIEYLDRVDRDHRGRLATTEEAPKAGSGAPPWIAPASGSIIPPLMGLAARPGKPVVSIAPPADEGLVPASAVIVGADEGVSGGGRSVTIEDGGYKLTPEALAKRAAELATAKGVEFHPVPKPASKPKARR
jgi:predicted transcriptional regulator